MARLTHATEYLRHNYSVDERLQMASELAESHNRIAAISEEKATIQAQLKERQAAVEQTIGKLSRQLASGFEMQNIRCRLEYDKPNMNEVSYVREDTGEVVKVRPFTAEERQEDLPLANREGEVAVIPPEKSAANVVEFFKRPEPDMVMEGLPGQAAGAKKILDRESLIHGITDQVERIAYGTGPAPEVQEPAPQMTDHEVLLAKAADIFRRLGKPSVSALQRELRLSYTEAVKLFDELKAAGEDAQEPETPAEPTEAPQPAAGDPWEAVTPAPEPAEAPTVESAPLADLFTEEWVDENGKPVANPNAMTDHKAEAKPKAIRKPRGFDKPVNESAW